MENICPITLEQITNPKALQCAHIFEESAIDDWLRSNNTCPLCRTVISMAENPEESSDDDYHDDPDHDNNNMMILIIMMMMMLTMIILY